MFERAKDIFNAMIGRKATCGSNCSCHSQDAKAEPMGASSDTLGDFIDLREMDPTIAAMLRELSAADRQAELLEQIEAAEGCDCECEPTSTVPQKCVHLDYIPVCHMREGDSKPENCAASTCPVRMFQVALEEMQKKAAMIAYG